MGGEGCAEYFRGAAVEGRGGGGDFEHCRQCPA